MNFWLKVLSYPFRPYILYRIYKAMTPQDLELLNAESTTEEERDRIAMQAAQRAFPNLDLV